MNRELNELQKTIDRAWFPMWFRLVFAAGFLTSISFIIYNIFMFILSVKELDMMIKSFVGLYGGMACFWLVFLLKEFFYFSMLWRVLKKEQPGRAVVSLYLENGLCKGVVSKKALEQYLIDIKKDLSSRS